MQRAKAKFCVNIRTQIRTLLVQQNSQWVELVSEGAFLPRKKNSTKKKDWTKSSANTSFFTGQQKCSYVPILPTHPYTLFRKT